MDFSLDDTTVLITELLLGNCGIIEPIEGFYGALRDLCDDYGVLLIFDEVITGFRVGGLECAQRKLGVEPDPTTLAKVIGGGFSVGSVDGRAEYMRAFTPTGDVFESGTFNGHPGR